MEIVCGATSKASSTWAGSRSEINSNYFRNKSPLPHRETEARGEIATDGMRGGAVIETVTTRSEEIAEITTDETDAEVAPDPKTVTAVVAEADVAV